MGNAPRLGSGGAPAGGVMPPASGGGVNHQGSGGESEGTGGSSANAGGQAGGGGSAGNAGDQGSSDAGEKASAASGGGGGASATVSVDASPPIAEADGGAGTGLALTYKKNGDPNVKFEVLIVNNGPDGPPIGTIAVRYYLKTETVPGPGDIHIDYAGWTGARAPHSLGLTAMCRATYTPIVGAKLLFDPDAGGFYLSAPLEAGATVDASASRDASDIDAHRAEAGVSRDASNADARGAPDASAGTGSTSAPFPTGDADGYLELLCASGQTLDRGDHLNIQVRWEGTNAQNDYSYQANAAFLPNPRMLLLRGGVALGGVAP